MTPVSGYHGLARLTHKINHYSRENGKVENLYVCVVVSVVGVCKGEIKCLKLENQKLTIFIYRNRWITNHWLKEFKVVTSREQEMAESFRGLSVFITRFLSVWLSKLCAYISLLKINTKWKSFSYVVMFQVFYQFVVCWIL